VISVKGTRVEGTCEWITQDVSYRAWLNDQSNRSNNDNTRLLWISGGPGKGKTMMSVFLTEELERHTASIPDAELVFFFCSAQDEKRNTAVAVLRGLIYQIIEKRRQLVKYALPYFDKPKEAKQTLLSLEALWVIFSKLIADPELGTVFCVLDGLDECEESKLSVLLQRIVGLLDGDTLSSTKGSFKLAIISRDMPDLHSCTRIRLDPDNDEKVVRDIELFVCARVAELSVIKGFGGELSASVQETLLARAEGTFLWVGFAMHELSQKQTPSEILEALEELPSGLPAIYGRMLQRISPKQQERSLAILRWTTLAARPLHLQELAAAIDLQTSSSLVSIEQATRDAIAICGPLLRIREQEVSLVHQSARDYLLRKECDEDAALEAFRLETEHSHLELAQKCLYCIASSGLQCRATDLNAELQPLESPLLRYATIYWPEHARSCSSLATKLFDPHGFFLQKEPALRVHWWQTYQTITTGFPSKPPPLLHMACILQIIPWIEAILTTKSWIPIRRRLSRRAGNAWDTALHIAAKGGNEAVIRLLVEFGADVNAKNVEGHTALHLVADRGHEAGARLLVDRANVNAKTNLGATALHFAAEQGHEAIVRLLVDRTDVTAKDLIGNTVLHYAALQGNKAVVQLLLDRGLDIKMRNYSGMTALHLAVKEKNEAMVPLLASLGADVNTKEDLFDTLMHSVISLWGCGTVLAMHVPKLLAVEAAISKRFHGQGLASSIVSRQSALHSAASEGNEAMVRLLIDLGADVEARNDASETVLHQAVRGDNRVVVQLLVDKGADVNAQDIAKRTVLHHAAWSADEKIIELLVGLGADVRAEDRYGQTALHLAARRGREEMVQMLVDSGADVNAKDSSGKTVLYKAVKSKNKELVQLLVDKGADV
jgi:ankyrin repeat protein